MVRLTKIILFVIVTFNFIQVEAKSPPPGTGTADVPANILIMLDNSGSMNLEVGSSSYQSTLPVDVSTDSSGNVYILDYNFNRISVYDNSGNLLKRFGSYGTRCNQWRNARQFTINNNEIYIADYL